MRIHETLTRDPRTSALANNGQARITDQDDARTRAELRAELETFVCDGQFGEALERILDRYLGHLDGSRQEAAWVSGFFGSGKSHLLKMLAHLWLDTRFEDGATARSLVLELPDEVRAHLRELDARATRLGVPRLAAAGTLLGGNEHVRLTVLSIILRAAGWPTAYPQAMFCFWLRDRGALDQVRQRVEAEGRDWFRELNNLYVSPFIANAVLEMAPGLAEDARALRKILTQQFPQLPQDITTVQFVEAARKALQVDGKLPLTLLVLDEVQQYIFESSDRAAAITEVAEVLQTEFDSRIMLVGAGQSALSAGTAALMWLRDRFRIAIELTDADVEAVTRKVLLRKKPSAEPEIEAVLEANAGEIDRHLRETRLGPRPEDRSTRIADYPLLPTRRRFWEACFQAVDAAGTQSQLRSQLRILYDSLVAIAERDLGAAIPASDLFTALAPSLVNTGVLLNEINTRIQKLDDGTDGGRLRRDLCGLVFLIGKLPRTGPADLGLRATPQVLADLLIDDISRDSGAFRKQVEEALLALAAEGVLMAVGDEYRLQTTEGAEWERELTEQKTTLRQQPAEIASARDRLFGEAVQRVISRIKLIHGESRVSRKLVLHFGQEAPQGNQEGVVVWVRDGWGAGLEDVRADARRGGTEDPTVHVHLPKKDADALQRHIIEAEAARRVLDRKGQPGTAEGQEARSSMETRLHVAERARDAIVSEILRSATVLHGGGSEVYGEELGERIRTAAKASLDRLYPRFAEGDHRAWEVALRRARDGSDQPFAVVGWDRPTEEHPVAREVLRVVGGGARGSEVLAKLKAPPFGWPQDAVAAAIVALVSAGHLRATRNGRLLGARELDQTAIKAAELRPESVRLSANQKIAIRGLFGRLDIPARAGEEEARAADFLRALRDLAAHAGGDPPLPPRPDTAVLDELERLNGAEQLAAILDHREELGEAIETWTRLAERAEQRRQAWDRTARLLRHATGLPVAAEVAPELEAIESGRTLLDHEDRVAPLAATLAAALREALTDLHRRLGEAVEKAVRSLEADATWTALDAEARNAILREVGLVAPAPLQVGSEEELLQALDGHPLDAWRADIDAVSVRTARALERAAARLAETRPERRATTVTVRRGTLADEDAVRHWLHEQEEKLLEAVKKGPVIVR